MTKWLAPSVSYQLFFTKDKQHMISAQALQYGYNFYIKPLRYNLNIHGNAGYYWNFNNDFELKKHNLQFSIGSAIYSLIFDNQYYYGRKSITFLGGYNFYVGNHQYDNFYLSIRYTFRAAENINHVLHMNNNKCPWYDKLFF